MLSEKSLVRILKIGVYLSPLVLFVFWKQIISPFVVPRIAIFQIFIELLALVWLTLIIKYPAYRPRLTILTIALLGLIGALCISAVFGINPERSFWSVIDRGLGLIALMHFFLFYLILQSIRDQLNWQRYLSYQFYISLAVALAAVIQKINPSALLASDSSRPGGVLGNPAFLAGYLIIALSIGAWLAYCHPKRSVRLLLLCGVAFEAVVIFLGETRGAIIGLVVGAAVLLIYFAAKKMRPFSFSYSILKNIPALFIIVSILFGGVFFVTRTAQVWTRVPGLSRLAQLSVDSAVSNRLIVWNIALKAFVDRPLTGWGPENFRYAFDRHYDPVLMRAGQSETYWDKPHSIPLELLATGGSIGFIAYGALLVCAFVALRRLHARRFAIFGTAMLAAYIVQGFFIFDSFGTYFMLMIFLAYVDYLYAQDHQLVSSRPVVSMPGVVWYSVAAVTAVAAAYLIGTNVQILQAASYQYQGINYFVNVLPVKAILSYKAGFAVKNPYNIDIRQSFLQTLKQMVFQIPVPDVKENIALALKEMKTVIAEDPNNHFWPYAVADARNAFFYTDPAFLEGGDTELAQAEALSPHRQLTLYASSKRKYLLKDYAGAIADMKKAIDLDPEVGDPHFFYGLLLLDDNQIDWGIGELFRAAQLRRVPETTAEVALVYKNFVEKERIEAGIQYFEQCHQIRPRSVDFVLDLALLNYQYGNPSSAKAYFERALMLSPDLIDAALFKDSLKPLFDELRVNYSH